MMTMWLQGSRVFVHIHVYTAERRCNHVLHPFFIMSPWQHASQPWKLWSHYLWTLSVLQHHIVAIFISLAVSESSRCELLPLRSPKELLFWFPGLKLTAFSLSFFCYLRLYKSELILGSWSAGFWTAASDGSSFQKQSLTFINAHDHLLKSLWQHAQLLLSTPPPHRTSWAMIPHIQIFHSSCHANNLLGLKNTLPWKSLAQLVISCSVLAKFYFLERCCTAFKWQISVLSVFNFFVVFFFVKLHSHLSSLHRTEICIYLHLFFCHFPHVIHDSLS